MLFAIASITLLLTGVATQNAVEKSALAAKGAKYWTSNNGKWSEDPLAPGAFFMLAAGNPANGGGSVMYVKFVPGASMGWHWHPGAEDYFGESGTLELHILKSSQPMQITRGSFASIPAHVIHRAICVSKEPCVFYLHELTSSVKHMADANGNEATPVFKN